MNPHSQQRKAYPLSGSILYGISSKRRLAEVLEVDVSTLRELQKKGATAYIARMCRPKPGKKPRAVQDPEPRLKAIQKRLNRLLQRVIHPEYVQAGLRGRSYRDNAERHSATSWVCAIDIQSFYPNCKRDRVYQFYRQNLDAAPDVAALLTDLTTINGHLPTGGPVSLLLSFWSYRDVFDSIFEASEKAGLKMTLYVDDMTFSGVRARRKFLNDHVKPILMGAGLVGHKIKSYPPKAAKHITGVVRMEEGSRVPFVRARRIRDDFHQLDIVKAPIEQFRLMNQLTSRLCEAAQIDPQYQAKAGAMADCRRNFLNSHPGLLRRGLKRKSEIESPAQCLQAGKFPPS